MVSHDSSVSTCDISSLILKVRIKREGNYTDRISHHIDEVVVYACIDSAVLGRQREFLQRVTLFSPKTQSEQKTSHYGYFQILAIFNLNFKPVTPTVCDKYDMHDIINK